MLGMMPPEFVNIVFPETSWSEFFVNTKVGSFSFVRNYLDHRSCFVELDGGWARGVLDVGIVRSSRNANSIT